MKKILVLGALIFGFSSCLGGGGGSGSDEYKAAMAYSVYADSAYQGMLNIQSLNNLLKKHKSNDTLNSMAFTDPTCFDYAGDESEYSFTFTNCTYNISDSILLSLLAGVCSISETTQTINGTMEFTETETTRTSSGTITLSGMVDVNSCALDITTDLATEEADEDGEYIGTGTICGVDIVDIEAANVGSTSSFCNSF